MQDTFKQLEKTGIIPVVVLESARDAEPLARALWEGGLPCAEITFRTAAAEEAIRIMTDKFPDMLVGAGTVLTAGQADRAVQAGAKFIVSPGLNPQVVKHCLELQIPVIPGVQTPSEMEEALSFGLNLVKFFPAEPAGGLKMIKAVAAPYTTLKFIPTGGINAQNVREYLAYDRVFACGGSWMVAKNLIQDGNFDKIKALVQEAASLVKEIRG